MHVYAPEISEPAVTRMLQRLSSVRRGIAVRCWVYGLMRVAWLILALGAADLALDWLFRLDRAQRTVLLGGAVCVIAWSVFRWLLQPLRTPTSDDALVLQLEHAHPRLHQALITSLQLARLENGRQHGMSPALVQRAIASGAKAAEEISVRSILDQRRFAINTVLLVLAAACFGGIVLALPFSPKLRTWFSRNMLLTSATWPQQSYLTIERAGTDGQLAFPRGQEWKLAVTVSPESKVLPEVVYVDIRGHRRWGSSRTVAMQRANEALWETAFTELTEPFEVRARGGDAVTEWVRATPAEPPELRELSIAMTPPLYTGLKAELLTTGQSTYPILHGTSLSITGVASKPLQKAELVHRDRRWPLQQQEGTVLQASLPASEVAAGEYAVELVDTEGFSAVAATFSLRWKPDESPQVALKVSGVGGMVLPQARIPLSCQVTDDFGLKISKMVLLAKGDGPEAREMQQELPLTNTNGTAQREWLLEDVVDLASIKLALNSNLTLRCEAVDNDDVGGPNTGRSTELSFRVVSEGEFRSELLRKEKRERIELEALIKSQEQLQTEIRVLAAARQPGGELSGQQEPLNKTWREQKIVGQKLGALADRMLQLAAEVRNNRLPDENGRLQNRLANEIASPIREIANMHTVAIAEKIDRAREAAESDRGMILAEISVAQGGIVARLKQVLEKMTSHQGFQEAIDLLYEIQKAQGEVHDQTNQAREERIRRILEGR